MIAIHLLLALSTIAWSQTTINDVAWIAGSWQGTLGKATLEEHWIAPAGGAMLGLNRVVSGPRMVMFEFLRIEQRNDSLVYIAQPNGRPPTEFKLTRASSTEAVFENPAHDHPKIILYRLEADGTLFARVEGDEKGKRVSQEFRFRKRSP